MKLVLRRTTNKTSCLEKETNEQVPFLLDSDAVYNENVDSILNDCR